MELEVGHYPAGADHPGQLPQGGGRVRHVAQQVGEGEGVERGVGERQLLPPADEQRNAPGLAVVGHTGHPGPQHLAAQVDPGDLGAGAGRDLACHPGRAGRHVEHRSRIGGGDRVDHRPAPPTVLAEREDFGQPVVAVGQPREQLAGELVGLAAGLGYSHGPLLCENARLMRADCEHLPGSG